jgi:hypothetical protein
MEHEIGDCKRMGGGVGWGELINLCCSIKGKIRKMEY